MASAGSRHRVLMHVGPHKTGTTTVQGGFHNNRDALRSAGVHYVGAKLQPTDAIRTLIDAVPAGAERDDGLRSWRTLMTEAHTARARDVVLSSEFLAEADERVRERLVDDLGSDDVRVVVTLRALGTVIPSQWQQFVQSGLTMRLEPWVQAALAYADEPRVDTFWRRHDHGALVERWVEQVGADNVYVLISDRADPEFLPRAFEGLLELDPGTLTPRAELANRSLTAEETESVRRFNEQVEQLNSRRRQRGLPPLGFDRGQRLAAWRHIKRRTPRKDEQRVGLPDAAREHVADLSRQVVDRVTASGAHVLGKPDLLLELPPPARPTKPPASVPAGLAGRMGVAVLAQLAGEEPRP